MKFHLRQMELSVYGGIKMKNKERKEQFQPGPWKHIVNRTTILDADGDRIAVVIRKGLYHYTAELMAAAPEMYAGNEDTLTTLDLIVTTSTAMCANCQKKDNDKGNPLILPCKACPISEILRLIKNLRDKIESIQKKARGGE